MTDELDGGKIVDFVSAGPKQYSYKCVMPDGTRKTVMKIRGLTLNDTAAKHVNFNSMKRLVRLFLAGTKDRSIETVNEMIRRTSNGIVTKTCRKRYRVVYDKCRVIPSSVCVPFGFKC